jgi:hypothetical protein
LIAGLDSAFWNVKRLFRERASKAFGGSQQPPERPIVSSV